MTISDEWEFKSIYTHDLFENPTQTSTELLEKVEQDIILNKAVFHESQNKFLDKIYVDQFNHYSRVENKNKTLFKIKFRTNTLTTMRRIARFNPNCEIISEHCPRCLYHTENARHAIVECKENEWKTINLNKLIKLLQLNANITNKDLWFAPIHINEKNDIILDNDIIQERYDLIHEAAMGIITEQQVKESINLGIAPEVARKITEKIIKSMCEDAKIRWNKRCEEVSIINKTTGINEIINKRCKNREKYDN